VKKPIRNLTYFKKEKVGTPYLGRAHFALGAHFGAHFVGKVSKVATKVGTLSKQIILLLYYPKKLGKVPTFISI
jgi:hypothetical protein